MSDAPPRPNRRRPQRPAAPSPADEQPGTRAAPRTPKDRATQRTPADRSPQRAPTGRAPQLTRADLPEGLRFTSGWRPEITSDAERDGVDVRRIVWIAAAVAALAIAVAALTGHLVGRAVSHPAAAANGAWASAHAGRAQVQVPARWRPLTAPSAGLAGLGPATAAFAPFPGLPVRAVVTLAPVDDPSLVPGALRATLAKPLPPPRATSLAGKPAWLYSPVATRAGAMELTVLPTSAGVLAVACVAPPATFSAAAGCASALRRADVPGAAPLLPSPDLALEAHARAVLATLDRARVARRAALRRAQSRRAQAAAAAGLSRDYANAANTLRPFAASGAPLLTALDGGRTAYARLARAAAAGRPARFGAARAAVRRAEARLARAIGALHG